MAGARPVTPRLRRLPQGLLPLDKLTPEDLDTAESYFELVLEKDPSYALAYAGLSRVWGGRAQMGYTPPHEAGPKRKAAVLQAIALDDNSAVVRHALAGFKTFSDWDWSGAEVEWRRALEIDPNAAGTHATFAHFLAITGRIDEAVPHSERALELDPFSAKIHGFYAIVLCGARRYDDAIAAARTALTMQPGVRVAPTAMECALVSKGMRDEHLAFQREQIARDPELVAAFERGLAEAGYEGAQRRMADFLAERREKSGKAMGQGLGPMGIAPYYLFAGDYDRAIDWLETAYEVHSNNVPYISFQSHWDPLRSDPRFQDLLRRMNLPTSNTRTDPD